jgi:hypothetical protein
VIRRNLTAITALAAAALLAAGCSTPHHPAASARGPQRIADCTGIPHVRPAIVVVRCIDGSMVAQKLKWSGWGTPVATATGTAVLNNCVFIPQGCATGDYESYPVVLIASGSLRCPTGGPAYARLQTVLVGRDGGVWPQHVIDAITPRPCGTDPPTRQQSGS